MSSFVADEDGGWDDDDFEVPDLNLVKISEPEAPTAEASHLPPTKQLVPAHELVDRTAHLSASSSAYGVDIGSVIELSGSEQHLDHVLELFDYDSIKGDPSGS